MDYSSVFGIIGFGRGVYFAKDASYSAQHVRYAGSGGRESFNLARRRGRGSGAVHGGSGGGVRFMYLARVLVGQYCLGNPSMIVPPPKDPSRPDVLHDSAVDQLQNPNIFVIFFDNQCYPEYLITFQ